MRFTRMVRIIGAWYLVCGFEGYPDTWLSCGMN